MRSAVNNISVRIAERAAHVLAWPVWFTGLLVGIPSWFLIDAFSRGRVDPGLGALVVVLTVQTSLDSGASNYVGRSALAALQHAVNLLLRMVQSVEEMAVDIRRELDRSAARDEDARIRDEQSAARDAAQIEFSNHVLDRLEWIERELRHLRTKGGSTE